jgi:hypothetical protein
MCKIGLNHIDTTSFYIKGRVQLGKKLRGVDTFFGVLFFGALP